MIKSVVRFVLKQSLASLTWAVARLDKAVLTSVFFTGSFVSMSMELITAICIGVHAQTVFTPSPAPTDESLDESGLPRLAVRDTL